MFAYCNNCPCIFSDASGNAGSLSINRNLLEADTGCGGGGGAVIVGTIAFISLLKKSISLQVEATREACLVIAITAEDVKNTVAQSLARANEATLTKHTNDERHHIVAQTATGAIHAREILSSVGIGVNEAQNIVLLNYNLHRRLHTKLYYAWVDLTISGAYAAAFGDKDLQRAHVEAALDELRVALEILDSFTR